MAPEKKSRTTLLDLARHLSLSRTTVSVVLSDAPAAQSIPAETRERVKRAASELSYTPHLTARWLRSNRTMSVGVMTPTFSDGYFTLVMAGIEACLMENGYFHFTVSHFSNPLLLEQYARMLQDRSVEGILLLNTLTPEVSLPMVAISGHEQQNDLPTIALDHERAAELALDHLFELGHRRIAFMVGQSFSLDSLARWNAIQSAAQRRGITLDAGLVIYLESAIWSSSVGYEPMKDLLSRRRDFTAVFAFNDTSAMGVIRALLDAGLSVPRDVSVLGFDDVVTSEFFIPRLTTIRQPLEQMGRRAAERLLASIQEPAREPPKLIKMMPELVVRESSAPVRRSGSRHPRA